MRGSQAGDGDPSPSKHGCVATVGVGDAADARKRAVESDVRRGVDGGPQIAYGYNVLLRLMFVMPEMRGKGIGKEILYRMTDIANETGCTITAVCVPVEWSWTRSLDDVRGSPGKERTLEEQCKYVADMFDNYGSAMKYLDLSKKENKEKQRRQRQRFLDCGFKRCLLKDNISKKNRQKLFIL